MKNFNHCAKAKYHQDTKKNLRLKKNGGKQNITVYNEETTENYEGV